jgi:glycosyltransferase involved in cell wall biosynthesis
MELFLLALAARLRNRGWRSVHVFAGEPSEEFKAFLARLDSPYLVARFPLTQCNGAELGRRLRKYHPDVVHTHFVSKFDFGLRPLKRLSGARRVVVSDQSSGAASRKVLLVRLLARLRGWWVGTYIHQVIAVSEFVRRRNAVDVHFPASKIRVVYNGVDTDRFVPVDAPHPDGFTIAYAGQLIPEKGLLTLLRAVTAVVAAGGDIRTLIAGEGCQRRELEAYCDAAGLRGRVEFLGQIDWVNRLFATADVVVVPSEWEEAFGFVAAEAAACGACVIVSDAGALPEVIGTDGKAGVIFARGDATDLAQRLIELMADPHRREQLRRAARERAVSHFSIERMVEGYCRYYEEIMGGL